MRQVTFYASIRPEFHGRIDAFVLVGSLADYRKLQPAPYEPEPLDRSWSGVLREREVQGLLWLAGLGRKPKVEAGLYVIPPSRYAEDGWPFESLVLKVSERVYKRS